MLDEKFHQSVNTSQQAFVNMETSATSLTTKMYAKKKSAETGDAETGTQKLAGTTVKMEDANSLAVHMLTRKLNITVK